MANSAAGGVGFGAGAWFRAQLVLWRRTHSPLSWQALPSAVGSSVPFSDLRVTRWLCWSTVAAYLFAAFCAMHLFESFFGRVTHGDQRDTFRNLRLHCPLWLASVLRQDSRGSLIYTLAYGLSVEPPSHPPPPFSQHNDRPVPLETSGTVFFRRPMPTGQSQFCYPGVETSCYTKITFKQCSRHGKTTVTLPSHHSI
jgi:hypothetical protein